MNSSISSLLISFVRETRSCRYFTVSWIFLYIFRLLPKYSFFFISYILSFSAGSAKKICLSGPFSFWVYYK